jgi:hypothetical protein
MSDSVPLSTAHVLRSAVGRTCRPALALSANLDLQRLDRFLSGEAELNREEAAQVTAALWGGVVSLTEQGRFTPTHPLSPTRR